MQHYHDIMIFPFGTLRGKLLRLHKKAKTRWGKSGVKLPLGDVDNVYCSPLPHSPYLKLLRMNYRQNGQDKVWDLLEVHDSVAIIVFNISRKVMILVKQFRPAIYYHLQSPADRQNKTIDTKKYSPHAAVSLEICSGIVDKNKQLEVIAQEEILEECGYKVDLKHLEKITSYTAAVGTHGALQTLYYCEVTDSMKIEQGGGVNNELIQVVEMDIPEIEQMMSSRGPLNTPPYCLFAIIWFLHHKANKFKKSS